VPLLTLGTSAQAPRIQAGTIAKTALHDFKVEVVAEGLVHPFAMAFTPEGDLLVTERPGRLRIVRKGVLLPSPVAGLPEILALGRGAMPQDGREQAGMRDVVLHPDFATNRLIYVSYTKPGANGSATSPWLAGASSTIASPTCRRSSTPRRSATAAIGARSGVAGSRSIARATCS
jgi:glucose/arabinose dehydrogenase